MRGKVAAVQKRVNQLRITPAYAGKSQAKQCSCMARWDHPRLCGEKHRQSSYNPHQVGSPPPMRGKGGKYTAVPRLCGITPAYAGKRGVCDMILYVWQDHPRLCGEKVKMSQLKRGDVGSPPPMRGKVPRSSVIFDCVRITPAYAGKSGGSGGACSNCWDHPRLCGEKQPDTFGQLIRLGSPPPMRGKD